MFLDKTISPQELFSFLSEKQAEAIISGIKSCKDTEELADKISKL